MGELIPPWSWNQQLNREDTEGSLTLKGKFDESWYQGRGVFGGLTAATLLQAMIELEPDRTPRSFTLQCAAPVLSGLLSLQAKNERRGSKVSHLSARLYQGEKSANGGPIAFASASFGDPRQYEGMIAAKAPPSAPPPEKLQELPTHLPLMPAFCQHVSYRYCWNSIPYTQQKRALIGGWCELRNPYPISYPYIAALLDSWPPAILPTLSAPLRAASVDFSYHFLCSPKKLSELERPFLYQGEVLALDQGYAEERNVLWDRQGIPVASARQLYAIS